MKSRARLSSEASEDRNYGEQDANGVDLSMIRELLRLTPLQRLRRADRARRMRSVWGSMAGATDKSVLEQLAEILLAHDVEFIVVGGQAEVLLGSPRVTYDVNLCYRRTETNLERLAAAWRELSVSLRRAPADLPFLVDARSLALGSNFTLTTRVGDLYLLGYLEPLGTYEDIVARAVVYDLGDLQVRVIDLDDLIAIKQHIGRPKDRGALMQLLAIKRLKDDAKEKQP
jgi:predicted nucleotidyltransferase